MATPVGNYVRVTEGTIKGAPDLTNFTTMNLYNATGQGGSIVGTARARAMEKIGSEIRLHLFDINITSGSFSAVRSFSQGHSNGINFVGNISDASALRLDIDTACFNLSCFSYDEPRLFHAKPWLGLISMAFLK